jgi:HAD domain in Swiss Army Knife RNA repair proteins
MKVLFLDIDGVLNSEEYALSLGKGGMLGINPESVKILDRIIDETGAKIVISSSWRGSSDLLADIRNTVGEYIDITPRLSGIRGTEVREWLRNHHLEVSRYAILDDDSDFFKYQPLFKTTWKKGLTDEIADKVIEYLNK